MSLNRLEESGDDHPMQLHIHVGLDTQIGKTLSAILTMRAVHNQRVLLLDIDHFGAKVHSLLNSLCDPNRMGGPYGTYKIRKTNIYVASFSSLDDLTGVFRDCTAAVTEITNWIRDLDKTFSFEYLIVDTGHSVLSYREMSTPLSFPTAVKRVKFWINYDYPLYTSDDFPRLYWDCYDWIKANHHATAFPDTGGASNGPFVHVFSPLSFNTEGAETDGRFSSWFMDTFHIPHYRKLVDTECTANYWLDSDHIVRKPDIASPVPSFDVWLKKQTEESGYNFTIGRDVARYWLDRDRFQLGKPTNVIFLPYDPDLERYRNKWTRNPPKEFAEIGSRMPIVANCDALRKQWHHLTVIP